jgi:hypothetical protein
VDAKKKMMGTPDRFIYFDMRDADHLAAIGQVSVAHGHLDHILRMTVKSLAGLEVNEALLATEGEGSAKLRDFIKKLARSQLGEGIPCRRLCAILERGRQVTTERNQLIHATVGRELDGDVPLIRNHKNEWKQLPSVDSIKRLARDILLVAKDLNDSRLKGFLYEALEARKNKLGKVIED